jgi:hypothetical protein
MGSEVTMDVSIPVSIPDGVNFSQLSQESEKPQVDFLEGLVGCLSESQIQSLPEDAIPVGIVGLQLAIVFESKKNNKRIFQSLMRVEVPV